MSIGAMVPISTCFFVLIQQALRQIQRLPGDTHVQRRAHQVPIRLYHLIDHGVDLRAEPVVRIPAVVFRHADADRI